MAIEVTIPSGKLYAFSPSSMVITGLTANDKVIISANGYSFIRFALGSTLTIPLSRILKSCFLNVDVNDVISADVDFPNTGSKLVSSSKTINVTVNDGTPIPKTVRALFGALQIAETEPLEYTIYRFGTLPLTITCSEPTATLLEHNTGDVVNPFGLDYFASEEDSLVLIKNSSSTILRQYVIKDVSMCSDLIYLRWVDRHCNYRYFAFEKIITDKNENNGETFTKEALSLNATNNVYKNPSRLISKTTNDIEIGSVLATYEQQKFISSLKDSVFVCKYLGDNKWLEVSVNVPNIPIDEKWQQNKSIEVEINLPNNYNPTL